MSKRTLFLIIILSFIATVLLAANFLLVPRQPALKVISVFPENQVSNISVQPKIKIEFNRPLKNEKEVIYSLNPPLDLAATFENDQKTLVLIPQGPLDTNTSYTLEIKNSQNALLWHSTFTTENLQGSPQVPYESEKYTQENYPLLKYLPYETDNFWITYSGPLTLKVVIKKGTKETLAPVVNDWIKSHGVNPQTHQIIWSTPAP